MEEITDKKDEIINKIKKDTEIEDKFAEKIEHFKSYLEDKKSKYVLNEGEKKDILGIVKEIIKFKNWRIIKDKHHETKIDFYIETKSYKGNSYIDTFDFSKVGLEDELKIEEKIKNNIDIEYIAQICLKTAYDWFWFLDNLSKFLNKTANIEKEEN